MISVPPENNPGSNQWSTTELPVVSTDPEGTTSVP
jgi:hypothetical protein